MSESDEYTDDEIDSWNDQFLKTFTTGLEEQRLASTLTDVTIQIGNTQFPCHRVILAAHSEYFRTMFSSSMKESVPDALIKLPNLTLEKFESLQDFMYTGKNIVTEDNAEELLAEACFYQMNFLREKCAEFLVKTLSPDNCIHRWIAARQHDCECNEHVIEQSFEFIVKNFSLVNLDEFYDLDLQDVVAILNEDSLSVSCEDVVCEAVIKWIERDLQNRKIHLADLMRLLRLPLASGEYVTQSKKMHSEIFKLDAIKPYLGEAEEYRVCPARRHDFTSFATCYRPCADVENMLLLLFLGKGYKQHRTELRMFAHDWHMAGYSFQENKWFELATPITNNGEGFAVCSFSDSKIFVSGGQMTQENTWYELAAPVEDNGKGFNVCSFGDSKIFVSGGQNKPNVFSQYNGFTNKWTTCKNMLSPRIHHSLVAVSSSLYVLGGLCGDALHTVDEYHIDSECWTTVGKLCVDISRASVAVRYDAILVIGGQKRSNKAITDCIQCFDTRTGTCSVVSKLPYSDCFYRSIGCNNSILIMTNKGDILRFGKNLQIEEAGKVDGLMENEYNVTRYLDKLYVFQTVKPTHGIESGDCSMLCFDLDTAAMDIVTLSRVTRFNCVKTCVKKCHRKEF